jgi:cobalt/nickel transport system permease protein
MKSLDARARLAAVALGTLIVSSTPAGALEPFVPYFGAAFLLLSLGGVPPGIVLRRCAGVSPFLLTAAALLHWQLGWPAALSVALKGYCAVLLLTFLAATTPLPDLLWALEKLRSPASLNLILGLMYRYTSLLAEEHQRMKRARESRTARPLSFGRFTVLEARHAGAVLLRGWDRAERIHQAMLARGFSGSWPAGEHRPFGLGDLLFVLLVVAAFGAARGLG